MKNLFKIVLFNVSRFYSYMGQYSQTSFLKHVQHAWISREDPGNFLFQYCVATLLNRIPISQRASPNALSYVSPSKWLSPISDSAAKRFMLDLLWTIFLKFHILCSIRVKMDSVISHYFWLLVWIVLEKKLLKTT